ncbi:MAG: hypothetical protein U0893_04215 [Chloroflexota bacterium]
MAEHVRIGSVRIGLASPDRLRACSSGEVTRAETFNPVTGRPALGGLFCEQIFGPTTGRACPADQYGIHRWDRPDEEAGPLAACAACGDRLTAEAAERAWCERRERLGHVELATPVPHPWYVEDDGSPIPLLLNLSAERIRRIVCDRQVWITHVDEGARDRAIAAIWGDLRQRQEEESRREAAQLSSLMASDLAQIAHLEAEHRLLVAAAYAAESVEAWIAEVDRRLRPTAAGERLEQLIRELHLRQAYLLRTRPERLYAGPKAARMTRRLHTSPLGNWYRARLAEPQRRVEAAETRLRAESPFDRDAASRRASEQDQVVRHLKVGPVTDEAVLRALDVAIGDAERFFAVKTGSAAIYDLLRRLDLDDLARQLDDEEYSLLVAGETWRADWTRRRRQLVEALRRSDQRPEWLMLAVVPVLPADLRPLDRQDAAKGDGQDARERFAPNLNARYARLVEANRDLRALLNGGAAEPALREAEQLVHRAVRSVFAALTARITGQPGRLRHDLLSKTVDFSGRAVAVPDPELGLDQCGLPIRMALELFRHQVARRLVERGDAAGLDRALRVAKRGGQAALDALEDVVGNQVVLVSSERQNGQPMMRAFEVTLADGDALRIHPLVAALLEVCRLEAFGDDRSRGRVDGAEVTVQVVLSAAAQGEARARLLPSALMVDPASGELAIEPIRDVVLGCYYLTTERPGARGQGMNLGDADEARRHYDLGLVDLQADIRVRLDDLGVRRPDEPRSWSEYGPPLPHTTVGRLIFHQAIGESLGQLGLPALPFENRRLDRDGLRQIVEAVFRQHGRIAAVAVMEAITRLGHHHATRSGVSIGIDDVARPPAVQQVVGDAEAELADVWARYDRGLLSAEERHEEAIAIWTYAKDRVTHEVNRALDPFGSLTMMAQSGAGGNIVQIAQIAGMRGLAALPSGEIAEMPIRSSFVAGLTPIEQLLGTQGTRRGALVTRSRQVHAADLLRRLVAATRDVAVTEDDCATARDQIDGIWIEGLTTYYQFRGGGMLGQENRLDHLVGRHLAADVVSETTGQLLLEAGTLMGEPERDLIREHRVVRVRVRSPMTCESRHGICRRCYGWDSMRRAPVEIGAPVGLLAALSLGGYADQLTMRIFRYGNPGRWVLKRDDEAIRTGAIRIGLPGIDALLETREAPHAAILSETAGVVEIEGEEESHGEARLIRVVSHWTNGDGGESYRDEHEYRLPPSSWVRVRNGERVPAGEPLTVGEPNPADILRILGRAAVQSALADELHALYSTQGVIVDDRHCEVVVRQMLRFVRITDAGDTAWLRGEIMDAFDFEDANLALRRAGGYEATAEPLVLGISEIAAHRAGFLAAALVDVEHTVRLRRAAIAGAVDRLDGLYERALVGALVPHSHPARTLSDDA